MGTSIRNYPAFTHSPQTYAMCFLIAGEGEIGDKSSCSFALDAVHCSTWHGNTAQCLALDNCSLTGARTSSSAFHFSISSYLQMNVSVHALCLSMFPLGSANTSSALCFIARCSHFMTGVEMATISLLL